MAGAADVRAEEEINPDTGIPKPELNVEARPVNALVRPVEAQHTALGQLAGALKEFNPTLGALQERFANIEKVQGTAQAEEAFAKDKGNWDQAVQNGDIPSFLHPYGRMAARERFGRMAGDKMGGDIETDPEYIQENQNATTMEQHDTAWSNARARWEAKNLGHASHADPLFQSNFQAQAAAQTADARHRAVAQIDTNYVNTTGAHLATEMGTHLDDLIHSDVSSETIQKEMTAMASDGSLPELVRKGAITNALRTVAEKYNDPSIYHLADGIQIKGFDGKLRNLSDDPDFSKAAFEGRMALARADLTQARDEKAQQGWVQDQLRSGVANNLLDALDKNPDSKIDLAPYVQQYKDAGLGNKINELNQIVAAHKRGEFADSRIVQDLTANIRDRSIPHTSALYVNTGKLIDALRGNQITVRDYRQLQAEVDKRDKGMRGRSASDTNDENHVFSRSIATVKEMFNPFTGNKSKIYGGDMEQAQFEAIYELSKAEREYKRIHPDADADKLEDYLHGLIQTMYKTDIIPGKKGPGGALGQLMQTLEKEQAGATAGGESETSQ